MTRHFTFEALVLKKFPVGEIHRGVVFFTRDQGLVTAIAHGAAKTQGKNRLLTSPFCRVQLKAYHDPVASSWKVVDLEERALYPGLAEDLGRYSTACLWAEILTRTQGLGTGGVFDLFSRAFDVLTSCPPDRLGILQSLVLWRLVDEAGLKPDFSSCDSCGRRPKGGMVAFEPESGEVFCEPCARQAVGQRLFFFLSSTIDLLLMAEVHDLEDCLNFSWEPDQVRALGESAKKTLERLMGGPLKTLIWE